MAQFANLVHDLEAGVVRADGYGARYPHLGSPAATGHAYHHLHAPSSSPYAPASGSPRSTRLAEAERKVSEAMGALAAVHHEMRPEAERKVSEAMGALAAAHHEMDERVHATSPQGPGWGWPY